MIRMILMVQGARCKGMYSTCNEEYRGWQVDIYTISLSYIIINYIIIHPAVIIPVCHHNYTAVRYSIVSFVYFYLLDYCKRMHVSGIIQNVM